jgi:GH18 family chitinase
MAVKAGFWYCKESQQSFSESNAPTHFTHLFCAFASISSRNHEVIIPVQYQDTFKDFNANAKAKNPDIKTFISIGGPDTDSKLFPSLVSKKENRTALITSSINLAQSHEFDGLDFFWPCEYPATQDDVTNLGYLFDEWRNAKNNLLLTATVFYSPVVNNSARYV